MHINVRMNAKNLTKHSSRLTTYATTDIRIPQGSHDHVSQETMSVQVKENRLSDITFNVLCILVYLWLTPPTSGYPEPLIIP